MLYKIMYSVLTVLMMTAVQGIDISDEAERSSDNDDRSPDNDERLLIIPAIQFNATNLFANNYLAPFLFGAVAISVLSVALSIGLGIILFSFLFKYKYNDHKNYGGTGYSTGYGTSQGHTSYRSFFDPSLIDWENFSVADMLHLSYETLTKYDPSNEGCQKRFICEVHRDTELLGFTAEKMVDLFSIFISSSNSAFMPEEIREVLDDYKHAAEAGRYLKTDCGELFPECKFSLSKVIKQLKARHSDANQIENET